MPSGRPGFMRRRVSPSSFTPTVQRAAIAGAVALLLTGHADAGPAVGQFELKTLESEPGMLEFQSQNAYSWGQPHRQTKADPSDPAELEYDDNTIIRQRHALEMEMGLTRYLKARIGIEFEKERVDEPGSVYDANSFDALKLSEVGAEVIGILKRREGDGWGLGVVVEIEKPIEGSESTDVNMGPIIEIAKGPWLFAAVPSLVHFFGGDDNDSGNVDDKWDFAYAVQLEYQISETWTFSLEAYGTVDRVFGSGNPSESDLIFGDFDQHRIGPILYYNFKPAPDGPEVAIGSGILAGLNNNTPDATLKLSVEVEF
jgi:hypothetical protein